MADDPAKQCKLNNSRLGGATAVAHPKRLATLQLVNRPQESAAYMIAVGM